MVASIYKSAVVTQDGRTKKSIPTTETRSKYLLADDHAAFRKTVRDFLPDEHIEVIECGNGAEAVELHADHQPDWTLMDIQMPGMDGLSAARSIRSHHPKARIIILTQHDSPELRTEAQAAGAIAYVLKDRLKDLPVIISSLLHESPNSNPHSLS